MGTRSREENARPRLESLEDRRLCSVTSVFQQGLNGYAAAHDTHLRLDSPSATFNAAARLSVDLDDGSASGQQPVQSLLRFDQLFGGGAGQVPAGSPIVSATLSIRTGSEDGDSSSSTSSLYRMISAWSHGATWDSMIGGISANGTEAASVADATAVPNTIGGTVNFNVTSSVQAWSNNPSSNQGWAILPGGTNGWWFNSSDAATVSLRPSLSITYDTGQPPPPPVNQAPNVSAGPDANIGISSSALLDGTVGDDGLPAGSLTTTWSKISGPGNVTFVNANAVDTSATFSLTGTYVLQLSASDGELSKSDTMIVTVTNDPPPPPPPTTTQNLSSLKISTDTGEKPQSKVWKHDGRWFGVFAASGGTYVWRLDGTSWTSILQLSSSTSTHADVRPNGNVAHALLYNGSTTQLASVQYAGNGNWQLWSARPSLASISLTTGTETAAMDIDGNGRMWVAYEAGNAIQVRYSDSNYSSWSSPISLATGVDGDDIADIAAFPDGSVGVLWSNQETERFGFRKHSAGANPSTWSTAEVPASQSAQSIGAGMADDHIHMAVASNGILYAAVKTGYDSSGQTCIGLLVRRTNGTWDSLHRVDTVGTRGIVVLNESANSLIVAYTSQNGNGNIYYKKSPLGTITFGSRSTLISGSVNNVSASRQNADGDMVFVAATSGSNMNGVRLAWPGAAQPTTIATSTPFSLTTLFGQNDASDDDVSSLEELALA